MSLLKSAILVLPLLVPLSPALASETEATLTVTGEGSVEAVPDLAILSLGVTSEGLTAAEAMAANTASQKNVVERLKAAGLADRDIQTSNLSLNPTWTNHDSPQGPRIIGYRATNQVMIRVRDMSILGAVLDAAITDGANSMDGLTFGLSNPQPAMDEARVEAVQDARAKAELMAKAAGVRLGRIVSISENGGYTGPAPMFRAEAALAAPVPVEAGEVSTTAGVTVVFELAQ